MWDNLTEAQLAAIGRIAIASAELDISLEHLIWHLCGFDEKTGLLFTGNMQLGSKLKLYKELMIERMPSRIALEHLSYFHEQTAQAITYRNVIIHGRWSPRIPKGINFLSSLMEIQLGDAIAVKHTQASNPKAVTVTANQLDQLSRLMNTCHQFCRRIFWQYVLKSSVRKGISYAFPEKSLRQLRAEIEGLNKTRNHPKQQSQQKASAR